MIPSSFIEEVLSKTDIVDVIDKFVPLKKNGANYTACCPFHSENTPSFSVSPTKQFYHCFGCGVHGDAIKFLTEYRGDSFVEALTSLSNDIGLTVPKDEVDAGNDANFGLKETLSKCVTVYKNSLVESKHAIDYLKSRGLVGKTAAKFSIGFAPANWQNLKSALDYENPQLLIDSGMSITSESGVVYDRFRDRIMFPIHNQRGEVIAFGGRIISGEASQDGPKYLNSPETALFQKGSELYGLYFSKKSIREKSRALVVEGYMDVVVLNQYGVDYSVATLGTATTERHIVTLSKFANEIVFCFDGDKAGRAAAWRALKNALPVLSDKLVLKFLFLPQGQDPDSYIQAYGKDDFESKVNAALPMSSYIVDYLKSENPMVSTEDKIKFLNDAEPVLNLIKNKKNSILLRKQISEAAEISESELTAVIPDVTSVDAANFNYVKRNMNSISKTRKVALIATIIPAEAECIQDNIFDLTSQEDIQLKAVVDQCKLHKDGSAAVVVSSLKGKVNDIFLDEFERDLNLLGEDVPLSGELKSIHDALLDSITKKNKAAFLKSIESKDFSTLTEQELESLRTLF